MKMLITPWGNFRAWNEVTYHFDGRSERSATSLKLLVNSLEPDYVLLIVPDSLLDDREKELLLKGEPVTYETHINYIRESVKDFLSAQGLEEGRIEIFVLPGKGTFPPPRGVENGVTIRVEGEATDYFYAFLFELYKFFKNNSLFSDNDEIEVMLDLTHGLNFVPVLTYRALKEFFSLLANFRKVKFVAYNADPVVTGVTDSNINVVEEALLIPKISLERTLKDKRFFVKANHSELRRSCRENKLEELYILYGSLAFGLPLLLAEEALSIKRFYEELNEVLERCVSDCRRLTECTYEDGTFSVKRSGTFQDSVRVAVFAFSVLESLCSVVRLPEGEGVPFKTVKELHEAVFSRSPVVSYFIEKELHSLPNVFEQITSEWKLYNDYLANSDKQEQKELDDKRKDRAHPDKRNFFAHAGFERNVVELKRGSTGEILLRYRPDRKKTVKKFVREEMERFALSE